MTITAKPYLLVAVSAYAMLLIALIWGLFTLRDHVLATYGSAEAQQDWQAWRSDVERQQLEPQTVQRRVPKSLEPPALVLMRDYFVTCLVGTMIFVSLVAGVFGWLAIGAATSSGTTHP